MKKKSFFFFLSKLEGLFFCFLRKPNFHGILISQNISLYSNSYTIFKSSTNAFWYSSLQEEQQKIEKEKEKKKENDIVFKAWLQKKRQQVLEMRRVQRAKQMEHMNSRVSIIQIWKLNLLTEWSLNIRLRTCGRSRKSGPGTTLVRDATYRWLYNYAKKPCKNQMIPILFKLL